jgi:hypothetical protein
VCAFVILCMSEPIGPGLGAMGSGIGPIQVWSDESARGDSKAKSLMFTSQCVQQKSLPRVSGRSVRVIEGNA